MINLSTKNLEFINKKKPKIGIIAPPFDSVPSPSGNAIYTLVDYLRKYSKFPILVFSILNKDVVEKEVFEEFDNIIYLNCNFTEPLYSKIFGYRLSKILFKSSNLKYLKYYKQVYSFSDKIKLNVLLQQEFIDLVPLLKYKFKLIIHQHAATNIANWKRFKNKIDEIVFVSNYSKDYDNKGHQEFIKSRTIYNGVDLNFFEIKEREYNNKITILYIGRLNRRKGILELIKAFNNFYDENIQLIIIGDSNYNYLNDENFYDDFYRLIKKNININFVGKVKQEMINQYYVNSDFVIVPSIGKEGLPKVITESLIVGKPVICSKRGGVEEFIVDNVNGIIIKDPVNELSIYNSISLALKNHYSLMKTSKLNVLNYRNFLSHTRMVNDFDELFNEKLNQK